MLKIRRTWADSNTHANGPEYQAGKISQDRDTMLMTILGGGLFAPDLHGGRPPHRPLDHDPACAPGLRRVSSDSNPIPQVPTMTRTDEIGHLSRVMRAMSAAIQSHIAMVQQSETNLRQLNQTWPDRKPNTGASSTTHRSAFSPRAG